MDFVEGSGFNLDRSLALYYNRDGWFVRDPLYSACVADRTSRRLCMICYDEFPSHSLHDRCGSRYSYCRTCVTEYLNIEIGEGRVFEEGCQCLCKACDSFLSEDDVKGFVESPVFDKFVRFRDTKLVLVDPLKCFCPNKNCQSTVSLKPFHLRAKCQKCKTSFCAKCNLQHSPFVTCNWASDSDFERWKRHTEEGCKRCPNCNLFIEKNAGCNHMTCGKCAYQFCWICMSRWNGGCSSKKFCMLLAFIKRDTWGNIPVLRQTAQVTVIAVGTGLFLGLVGTAAGLATAAAGVAVGVGVPAVIVGAPVYGAYKGVKKIRKARRGPTYANESSTSLADNVKWGVRVLCHWSKDDPAYLSALAVRGGTSFMNINGRTEEGIFIGYSEMGNRLDGCSPLLYFVPEDISDDVLQRVLPCEMIEIQLFQNSLYESSITYDLIASNVRSRFLYPLTIRTFPAPRRRSGFDVNHAYDNELLPIREVDQVYWNQDDIISESGSWSESVVHTPRNLDIDHNDMLNQLDRMDQAPRVRRSICF